MTHLPVMYASAGWGVHDQRWVAALEACGFAVRVFDADDGDLRHVIDDAEPPHAPVLAGPLMTVTRQLVGLARPIVGLSWGYDLQAGHSASTDQADLAWLPRLDRLIVDSPSTRDVAIDLGVDPATIFLLPWGIDLDAFTPEGPATSFSFPVGSRIVLSLRTHDQLYRTADVIEAFGAAAQRDPALCLVMGGAGSLTDQHEARIQELGLAGRTRFLGQVPETSIAGLLRSADLYVTASETDGTSVTLLQAMACGVPVIASNNPGNDWWIEDGVTGRTFPVGDIAMLADLLATERRSDERVARARAAVVERADWQANRRALGTIMRPEPNPAPVSVQ